MKKLYKNKFINSSGAPKTISDRIPMQDSVTGTQVWLFNRHNFLQNNEIWVKSSDLYDMTHISCILCKLLKITKNENPTFIKHWRFNTNYIHFIPPNFMASSNS